MSPMGKSAQSALTVHEDLNDSTGIPECRGFRSAEILTLDKKAQRNLRFFPSEKVVSFQVGGKKKKKSIKLCCIDRENSSAQLLIQRMQENTMS